ncbi:MAG: sialate O-acetylesterase [Planctomycetota bacterium]
MKTVDTRVFLLLAAVVSMAWMPLGVHADLTDPSEGVSAGSLKMPAVFGDYMVLQRDKHVEVWGQTDPHAEVSVAFNGQRVSVSADGQGRWSATLEPSEAGGPFAFEVSSNGQRLAFDDVLVGEVWLCSGQSNMDMRLRKIDDAEAEIAASSHDQLRLFRVERAVADEPAFDVDAYWAPSNAEDAKNFSAVGYVLGRELQRELGVPVGIIHTAYGGTPVEAWTPLEALANNPETQPMLARHERRLREYQEALAAYEQALAANADLPEGETPMAVPNEPTPPTARYAPAGLYHAMLKPLAPYTLRGFAWYQGESNIWRAAQYEYTLTEMIDAWRADWDDDTLPFGVIQLPGYALPPRVPRGEGSWPELREAQLRVAQQLDHVGLVVTTDVSDPTDIHPTAKRPVGERLARWALHAAYGRDVVPTGPLLIDHRVEGDKMILTFDHVGSGLASADGEVPNGFCVAGPDKKFRWATHVEILDERTLAVGEAKVPNPQAVRYGWDDYIPWATLTNAEGLPASPFRTDDWDRITEDAR